MKKRFLLRFPTLCGLIAVVAAAAIAASPTGHWEGAIDLPGTQLEIRVDLETGPEPATFGGTIDIPVQSIRSFQLVDVVVDESAISFRMPNIPGDPTFEGTVAEDDSTIAGTFTQNGQTFPFTIERREAITRSGETPSQGVPGNGLVGHWQGSLRAGPSELRLVLHVDQADGADYVATIDSIDQGANGIPVSQVTFTNGAVSLELAVINATYSAQISGDGAELQGSWKQGPIDSTLVFRRLAAPPDLSRPQDPVKPYPYEEREVFFTGGSPEVTLAGTLTMPRGDGPFPAVVLMSGSGPQDRNETLMGHRPFLVLADHLTRQGIAVLRYDDRGTAQSTGQYAQATHVDFTADARAAFEFLRSQPGIDVHRVGLCGHSEGGVYAPLVAADDEDVAFIVMLAGVGVPLEQLLQRQREDIMRVVGLSEDNRARQLEIGTRIFATIREFGISSDARAKVRGIIEESVADYSAAEREALGLTTSSINQQIAMMMTPWFAELLVYDPAPALAKVRCPVLALNGQRDLQVAWQENLEGIRAGLAAGGNTKITTVPLPELNHLFQHCTTGAIAEYGIIEETMSPEVLARVATWILQDDD